MVVKDYLSWILDKPHDSDIKGEEQYKRNIEFVHSLGLKCDCVGWSMLDLSHPDADEILDRIEEFCKTDGWLARGGCGRIFEDVGETEWYELCFPDVANDSWHFEITLDQNGKKVWEKQIKAYMQKSRSGLYAYDDFYVSEKFRNACRGHNVAGVEFCWVKDIGRYDSMQYFRLYAQKHLPYIACDRELRYSDELVPYCIDNEKLISEYRHIKELYKPHGKGSKIHEELEKLGGKLSRISEVFYDMQFHLPDYYPKSEMPDEGFVRVYWAKGGYYRNDKLLVHRKTAEMLLSENALSSKNLKPVLLYDEAPEGYCISEMHPEKRLPPEYIKRLNQEYEQFIIQPPRPCRNATAKEAVKKYRKAKLERKEDFKKKMKKELAESLSETEYSELLPYYLVANGGFISDEYEILPYEETERETKEFLSDIVKEELSDVNVTGIVFAKCADGDKVILKNDGSVYRFSHEIPEIVEEWKNLAQFFYDSIEYEE